MFLLISLTIKTFNPPQIQDRVTVLQKQAAAAVLPSGEFQLPKHSVHSSDPAATLYLPAHIYIIEHMCVCVRVCACVCLCVCVCACVCVCVCVF